MSTELMTAPSTKISTERVNVRDQFAAWVYRKTMVNKIPNGRLISKKEAGDEIDKLRGLENGQATFSEVWGWMAYTRLYFEKNFQCTLWNIPGRGWRGSTKIETAKYYGKSVKKTIAWADRTRQLQTIVERKYIPYAIQEVVGKAEGGIKSLSGMRKRFVEQWGQFQIAEQKQIEAIQNGK